MPDPSKVRRARFARLEREEAALVAGREVTEHAQLRMNERGVTREQVAEALRYPDVSYDEPRVNSGRVYVVGQLCVIDADNRLGTQRAVVTVFWRGEEPSW